MTLVSDLVLSLPTILTAISAIAAASIAYLNYRSRPILIRTLERHSDDVKALASRWKGELPILPRPEQAIFPEISFPLPVESELLFADIWEHVPPDISLREAWNSFRIIAEEHYLTRQDFLKSVRTEIERRTGLSHDNSFQKRGYTSDMVSFLFRDTFEMMKGESRPYASLNLSRSKSGELSLLLAGSQGLAAGSEEDIAKVEKVWVSFVNGMEKENLSLFKAATELVEEEARFRNVREQLEKLMNEFAVIPLYSTRCKYVKRAEGSGRRRANVSRHIKVSKPKLRWFRRK